MSNKLTTSEKVILLSNSTIITKEPQVNLILNVDNPPTVKQNSVFNLINNLGEYRSILETSDQVFIWNTGNFPVKSDGNWYLFCVDGLNEGSIFPDTGVYGASQNVPDYDYSKGDIYNSDGRVIGSFKVTGGVVGNAISYENSFKNQTNDIINGPLDIWQEGISFVSSADGQYLADQFLFSKSGTGGDVTITQDSDTPDERFNFSMKIDTTIADAVVDVADGLSIQQKIEGFNFKKFAGEYGTLGFYVKSNKTGIYCVSFRNSGNDRSFVREYTVTASWTFIEIPPVLFNDQTGTWNYINGVGINITWTLMAGTNFQTAAGIWQPGNFIATLNQVNFMDNIANEFFITGIIFNRGIKISDFSYYDHEKETARCQRYFEKTYLLNVDPATVTDAGAFIAFKSSANTSFLFIHNFTTEKRVQPTITFYSPNTGASGNCYDLTSASDRAMATASARGTKTFRSALDAALAATNNIKIHWIADARL